MNDSDKQLAVFQACLLDALYNHETADQIIAALQASDATLPFRDYLSMAEPEMLEVAAELVKKWGVKGDLLQTGELSNMPH
jgi:hypothetical protein